MKYCALFLGLMCSVSVYAEQNPRLEKALYDAQQQQLAQDVTWQRLMYANAKGKSDVSYQGYFISTQGQQNLEQELKANLQALFLSAHAPLRLVYLQQDIKSLLHYLCRVCALHGLSVSNALT